VYRTPLSAFSAFLRVSLRKLSPKPFVFRRGIF
jgi:hypothetical protein